MFQMGSFNFFGRNFDNNFCVYFINLHNFQHLKDINRLKVEIFLKTVQLFLEKGVDVLLLFMSFAFPSRTCRISTLQPALFPLFLSPSSFLLILCYLSFLLLNCLNLFYLYITLKENKRK